MQFHRHSDDNIEKGEKKIYIYNLKHCDGITESFIYNKYL